MSQHYYETIYKEKPITIFMGWDRPLQGFFMMIYDENHEPIYNNLEQEDSHPLSLVPFLDVLLQMNISVPEEMIADVISDKKQNMGPKKVFWPTSY